MGREKLKLSIRPSALQCRPSSYEPNSSSVESRTRQSLKGTNEPTQLMTGEESNSSKLLLPLERTFSAAFAAQNDPKRPFGESKQRERKLQSCQSMAVTTTNERTNERFLLLLSHDPIFSTNRINAEGMNVVFSN